MAKLCSAYGCRKLIPNDQQRCPDHTRQQAAEKLARRKQLGRNGARWQRIRDAILERDGHICRRCGAWGDSIHRLGGGYHHDDGQYIVYCRSCHASIENVIRNQ